MKTLLILDPDAQTYVSEIEKQHVPPLEIRSAISVEQGEEFITEAHFILGQPSLIAPLLDRATHLLWVQSTFAGIEPLCVEGLRADYLLTGVKNVFGVLMSEYVFAYILARERSLLLSWQNQQKREWQPIAYRSLDTLTIGIAGLGSIGCHVAATAAHFGMQVLGMKRTPGKVAHVNKVFLNPQRTEFLSPLDYLVLTLPDTPDTRHFIRLEDLRKMKKTAVLINVGRGYNVDQDDLVTALRNGDIAGAVLDVFEQEPLPPESPLWGMPDTLITPHNSAVSFPSQIASIFCENYQRFMKGETLRYIVDFSRGY